MITLRQLEVLVAVVRAGGVTAAAQELFVTQPSVSATLRALEREVGAALFTGRGRHRSLTPAGRTVHDRAVRILGEVADLPQAVADLAETPTGTLRIAAVTTAGEHLLPAVLGAFHETHPEVDLDLAVANRAAVRRLLRDDPNLDLAVMGRPPAGIAVEAEPFLANRLHLVRAPDLSVEGDVLESVTLLLREPGSGTRAAVEEVLAAEGHHPRTMTIGSNPALRAAVVRGLGVAVLPELVVAADLERGTLVTVSAPGFPLLRWWHVVRRVDRRLTAPARAFTEVLRAWTAGTLSG